LIEVVLALAVLVLVACAYLAGVAVGKIAASKELGRDEDNVRISWRDVI
jgi:hypothetical protein